MFAILNMILILSLPLICDGLGLVKMRTQKSIGIKALLVQQHHTNTLTSADVALEDLDTPIKLKSGAGKLLNNRIISILGSSSPKSERVISTRKLIDMNRKLMNRVHLLTLLQRCAKEHVDVLKIMPLTDICTMLQDQLSEDTKFASLKAHEVSALVYSMRLFDEDTPGMLEYQQTTLRLLDSCKGPFTAQNIGCSFYGLQRLSGQSVQTRALIKMLIEKGTSCTPADFALGAQEFSMSVYGLRKMEYCDEVNKALLFLSSKVSSSASFSTEICIANTLNGLQNCNADVSSGAQVVLKLILPHIQSSQLKMSAQGLGSSYMGLRSSRAICSDVKPVIAALNQKLNSSTSFFNAPSISSILNGLRCSDDELSPDVCNTLKNIANRLEVSDDEIFDPKTISNSLGGLSEMSGNTKNLRRVLNSIAKKIALSSIPFTSLDIGLALYGVKKTPPSDELNTLLAELTKKVRVVPKMREKDIAKSFYAFQSQEEPLSKEVKSLITALTDKIAENSEDDFSPQSIGMIMLGIQRQKGTSREVRRLLSVLSSRVNTLDSQAIGNVLYSFQKTNSESQEVRTFLKAFASRIEASPTVMKTQEIANALWGLQSMNSDYVEVRRIISVITDKIALSFADASANDQPLIFTGQGIGNALYGLQSMSDEVPETTQLLGYFPEIILNSPEAMKPQDIGYSLFGLQGFSSNSKEIRYLLSALAVRMSETDDKFSGKDLGYCVSGMHNKDLSVPEVISVIQELSVKLARSRFGGEPDVVFVQKGKGIKVKLNSFEAELPSSAKSKLIF